MAVEGVPSSESRWISLSATNSPVWRLRPLNTYKDQYKTHLSYYYYYMYRRIGAFTELFQLLKAAWVSSRIHALLYSLTVA